MVKEKSIVLVVMVAISLSFAGSSCKFKSGGSPDNSPSAVMKASAGFLERQAEYLQYCNDNSGPGSGRLDGQVCRAFTGAGTFDETVITNKLDNQVDLYLDTSDFTMAKIIRMLWIDQQNHSLPDALRTRMKTSVLNFKYWLDETDPSGNTTTDSMCWWSENHQILFHSLELLAGLLYPDEVFTHSGMTGREHAEHARPMVHRWLDSRGRFGFSEFHSNVYFNEDMPALVNLVDFADEQSIRTKATMVLDVLAFDMANNFYHGIYATAKGRTYPSSFVGGLGDSITEAAWMMLDNVPINSINDLSPSHFTAAFLATSSYFPPPILERIAAETADYHEHRQRDSIKIADGPAYGITYNQYDDVIFWWGMTGYVAPEIIEGTFNLVDHYEMWDDYQWKDLTLLQPFVGTPMVQGVAQDLAYMFRGTALEEVNTYTYRTPHYQLSGAQDWKPFYWTGQVVPWMGTLSKQCFVITAYPTTLPPELGLSFGSDWTGGFVPRFTMNKNVAVIQYHLPALGDLAAYIPPGIDWSTLLTALPHAYFPRSSFDEYVESGNWLIGRKGEGYLALYTSTKGSWVNDYDIPSTSSDNVYIVEMGDLEHNGTFTEFVTAITGARVEITGHVEYDSPSQGTVSVGWFGPMTVDGVEIDLGPFPRWENSYAYQEFGTRTTYITDGGQTLMLDFVTPKRKVIKD